MCVERRVKRLQKTSTKLRCRCIDAGIRLIRFNAVTWIFVERVFCQRVKTQKRALISIFTDFKKCSSIDWRNISQIQCRCTTFRFTLFSFVTKCVYTENRANYKLIYIPMKLEMIYGTDQTCCLRPVYLIWCKYSSRHVSNGLQLLCFYRPFEIHLFLTRIIHG